MHLLYITFGKKIANHIQAHFSILSFWVEKQQVATVNIITDEPSFYTNIADRVNIIPVNEETLRAWRGPHNFFWRIKIKAIEMVCSLYANEPIMYLDTDTFLYASLGQMVLGASHGQAFMHENEGRLSADKSKTARRMFGQINGANYSNVVINNSHCMWNAGVVFTPNTQNNQECLLALNICDAMCQQGVTRRLIEQFALSVALQQVYGLHPASPAIAHYWSNKEQWNRAIETFLLGAQFKGLSIDDAIRMVPTFNFDLPVKVRVRNTNQRLKALADRLYPAQNASYIQYHL